MAVIVVVSVVIVIIIVVVVFAIVAFAFPRGAKVRGQISRRGGFSVAVVPLLAVVVVDVVIPRLNSFFWASRDVEAPLQSHLRFE